MKRAGRGVAFIPKLLTLIPPTLTLPLKRLRPGPRKRGPGGKGNRQELILTPAIFRRPTTPVETPEPRSPPPCGEGSGVGVRVKHPNRPSQLPPSLTLPLKGGGNVLGLGVAPRRKVRNARANRAASRRPTPMPDLPASLRSTDCCARAGRNSPSSRGRRIVRRARRKPKAVSAS